jgi:hypothetical protein
VRSVILGVRNHRKRGNLATGDVPERIRGDIGTILLDGCQCLFLSVILLAFRKCQIEPIAALVLARARA